MKKLSEPVLEPASIGGGDDANDGAMSLAMSLAPRLGDRTLKNTQEFARLKSGWEAGSPSNDLSRIR